MDRFGRNAGCTKMCGYECRIYENIDTFNYIIFIWKSKCKNIKWQAKRKNEINLCFGKK